MKPLLFRLSLLGCLVGALFPPSLRATAPPPTSNLVLTFPQRAAQFVSDPARDLVYASLYFYGGVSVLDPKALAVPKPILVGAEPLGMAISADGTKLYVALSGATQIAVIDLTTETVLPSLTIAGTPNYIAAGPDDRLYVSTSNGLLQINALTGATESNLGAGGYLQLNQARTELFVGVGEANSTALYRYDVSGPIATLSQVGDLDSAYEEFTDFKLSHNGSLLASVEVDLMDEIAHTAILDPQDLNVQYGSFDQYDNFAPFDPQAAVTFSPDDQVAYLVTDHQIAEFDPVSFRSVASLPNPDGDPGKSDPVFRDVITDPTGRYLFVADPFSIDVYDLQANLAVTANAVLGDGFYYGVPIYLSPATITVTGLPGGLTFDEASRTISGTPTETGVFPVVLKATNGSTTVTVTLTLTIYSNSRALNISTRALVQPGDDALIAGFIVQGLKPIVVRALGPSLTANGIPLPGRLMDPMLEVYDSTNTLIGSNNNWKAAGQTGYLTEFGLAPTNDFEAALYLTVEPGAYTVVVRGIGNTSGIALAEVYDIDAYFHPGNNDVPRLVNLSTRGLVETGDNVMIGGFIIGGPAQAKMLLRGLGPSLSQAGVQGVLADPQLALYNSDGTKIYSNNNWKDYQEPAIEATGLAPTNPLESAIDINLAPGAYTAILSGVNNGTGVGQIEAYNIP